MPEIMNGKALWKITIYTKSGKKHLKRMEGSKIVAQLGVQWKISIEAKVEKIYFKHHQNLVPQSSSTVP